MEAVHRVVQNRAHIRQVGDPAALALQQPRYLHRHILVEVRLGLNVGRDGRGVSAAWSAQVYELHVLHHDQRRRSALAHGRVGPSSYHVA